MDSLQNNFLIAMPALKDPFFERSVTYICEHNKEGAMGIVINQPIGLSLDKLLEQVDIPSQNNQLKNKQVFAGGPVHTDRGFVLHSPQSTWRSSLKLSDDIMITTSKDILYAIGTDAAPENYLIALGFAGWEEGQLEQELLDNSWLTLPADSEIIFKTPIQDRWQQAAAKLGVDIWQISSQSGRA